MHRPALTLPVATWHGVCDRAAEATFAWIGQRLPRLVSIVRPEATWLGVLSPTQFCVYNHGNTGLVGILPVSSAPDSSRV